MSTNKSVARWASTIAFATFCSRLLGFVRDIVIARLFGIREIAQAFVVAFRIPNLFRDFVGEGAANASLVPVFSEYSLKQDKEEFWRLANVVLNLLLVVLSAIVLLGIIFSPLIIRLIAPGFIASPEKFLATVKLNRIIFPYLLLICLAAYSTGILNSLKHFSIPAFAPCLLNISIIICALAFGEGIVGLASGVLIGGILQLAIQIPVLYKKGFRLNPAAGFRHPEVKTIGRLMLPRIASSSIYQLNNFVDSIFGSLVWFVGEGGVAVLYFAYRLIQFPLGIFSNALSQALLPTFSTQSLEPDREGLKSTLAWALRAVSFVIVPAQAAFIFLAKPVVLVLFGGGRFDSTAVDLTASCLIFYSIGLSAYGANKILQSCFFGLKDTLTPAKISGLALGMNIALNCLLMFPLKIAGIALATSISGVVSFLVLFNILRRKIGDFRVAEVVFSFVRIALASLCMGLVAYLCFYKGHSLKLNNYLNLGLTVFLSLFSYAVFCLLLGVREMRELWQWVSHKK
ncbi:MAG: murein biosynthesis integral membrane protein MurJ [Candidatus Omnitrophica bacterium]|nr:murein biosynthesis integral membrane protein MurJ [Candidatus Omnitrophota bacterium]